MICDYSMKHLNSFSHTDLSKQNAIKRRRMRKQDDQDILHCNCKQSQCVKLYCECFAQGKNCGEGCNCFQKYPCLNTQENQEIKDKAISKIVERDPLAFHPKIKMMESIGSLQKAKHFRGCHCTKSECKKNYCECFQNGVICSELCRCQKCRNKIQLSTTIETKIRKEGKHSKTEKNYKKNSLEGNIINRTSSIIGKRPNINIIYNEITDETPQREKKYYINNL